MRTSSASFPIKGGARIREPQAEAELQIQQQPVGIELTRFEVLRDLCSADWHELKNTADKAHKKETQRNLLNKYREHLDGYLANGDNYNNLILFYGLVWAMDTQEFDFAIRLADAIVKTGQHFELGFKRNAVTLLMDQIMLKQEPIFDEDSVLTPEFLTVFDKLKSGQWSADNVITTGKYYRMAGRSEREQRNFKQALDYFNEAQSINPRAGVKALIAEMEAKV